MQSNVYCDSSTVRLEIKLITTDWVNIKRLNDVFSSFLAFVLRDSLLLYENNDLVEIFKILKNLDRYTSENNVVGLLK